MFNDYEVFQWIKFRQQEMERKAKNAWKQQVDLSEVKPSIKRSFSLKSTMHQPCCNCA
ncbi:hypothetical protein [Heyndrickxia shackletonii]|uniref:hypothetical protein n=1 Tax=Heyndrickxia shackletonii TaxID=157838 RepID=UPI000ACF6B9B|nr:hypothetical protein [Heyndrickxia shackletonii]NEY98657.1 hypothetical protein [Heyndrickxia shackletonii]